MKKILIAGTGGFSKEVLMIAHDLGILDEIEGFVEPDGLIREGSVPKQLLGKPVFPYSFIDRDKHKISLAIGNSIIREKIVKTQLPAGIEFQNFIHPSAIISPWVELGTDVIVCAGTIITCDIKIGNHCHFNLNTTVGHDCVINDFFTTAPNVNISGNCTFENHVYLGTNSILKQGLEIVEKVTVGMGAVVTKSITESGVYIGSPAKKMK